MERTRRKGSGLLAVAIAFACSILVSLGAVPRSPKEDPEVAPFARELRAVLDAATHRHLGRTALIGETRSGDLDAEHARVVARLAAMGDDAVPIRNQSTRQLESAMDRTPWSPERIAVFRSGARGVLEALVAANQTSFDAPLTGRHVDAARLRNLCEAECMLRWSEGRVDEAVEAWLAGVQFLLDVEAVQWLQSVPFTDADLAALPPAVRSTLAAGLARADARLATIVDPRAELADFTLPLCDGSYRLWDWDARELVRAWRFGFDPAAQHLLGLQELFAAMPSAGAADATGEQREAEWARVKPAMDTWLSWYVHEITHEHEQARRRVCARFRMVRLALAFHAREEMPVVVDPWNGDPFEVVVDGDTATMRAREMFEGREWVAVRR